MMPDEKGPVPQREIPDEQKVGDARESKTWWPGQEDVVGKELRGECRGPVEVGSETRGERWEAAG